MSYLRDPLYRRGRARRGVTLVEMAFVLPVVLLFVIGIIDFALVMYAYGTVSEAARVGARYAMVHGSLSAAPVGPAANNSTVETVVKAGAPSLDPTKMTVASTWGTGSNDEGNPVTVTVTYDCPLTMTKSVVGSVTVTGTTTMLITY